MEVTLISTCSSFQGWLAEKCTEIPATILKTNILSLVLPLYGDNLRCHGRPYIEFLEYSADEMADIEIH